MKINLLKTGVTGAVILALCCFTPVLVVLFATLGLGAFIGYLDYILLPSLGFFILLTLYALMKQNKTCCKNDMSTNFKKGV